MTVKLKLATGETEIFETGSFTVGTCKSMLPEILQVEIYLNGKRIIKQSRPFKFFYKHFTFKTAAVQDKIKQMQMEKMQKATT